MKDHLSVVAGWSRSVVRKVAEEDMVAADRMMMMEEMMMLTNLSAQIATTEEGAVVDITTIGVVRMVADTMKGVGLTEEERGAATVVEEVIVEARGALIEMEAALPTITTRGMLQIVTIINGQ